MEFRLFYRGELKANGNPKHKHEIREQIHKQLAVLWHQKPLVDVREHMLSGQSEHGAIRIVEGSVFAPLVHERQHIVAELHVTMLRPEEPGSILTQGGDIDNRLKTLFDALRMPKTRSELPSDFTPPTDGLPFFCLLEDDNLITNIQVSTDRLLESVSSASEVILLMHVRTKITRATPMSLAFGV